MANRFFLFGSRHPHSDKQPRGDSDYDVIFSTDDSKVLACLSEHFGSSIEDLSQRIRASDELWQTIEKQLGFDQLRSDALIAMGAKEVSIDSLDLWLYIPQPAELHSLRLNWNNQDVEIVPGIPGLGLDGETLRGSKHHQEIYKLTGLE
jgi:hypothetical protein